MVKYIKEDTSVTFAEIPDEISLCINISNCQNNCIGCHSLYLKRDIGEELDYEAIDGLISKNRGITCFLFMGEGKDPSTLKDLALYTKSKGVKIGIYSGRPSVEDDYYDIFDYVKVGPYIAEFGPLDKETTNQRLYYHREDVTYKFWKKGTI